MKEKGLTTVAGGPCSANLNFKHDIVAEAALSPGQKALWFLQKLNSSSPAYHIFRSVEIKAELDVDIFHDALQALVDRHASLRTTFTMRDNEPIQQIHRSMDVYFRAEDASFWNEKYLNRRLTEESLRPFNLEQGSLFRINVFSRSSRDHIVLFNVHHIATDLWSLAIMIHELGVHYDAKLRGTLPELSPLRTEYVDYIRNQTERLMDPEGARLWQFWKQKLSGELPILNLPTDHPRPEIQTYLGRSESSHLGDDLVGQLKAVARQQKTTLFTTLIAAFQILLHRYTGQEDIIVGTPKLGRRRETLRTVGYFVNTIPLRVNVADNPKFSDFLYQVHQTIQETSKYEDYPFSWMVENLQPERDLSRSPIYQVLFTMQKTTRMVEGDGVAYIALGESGGKMNWGSIPIETKGLQTRIAPFDITMLVAQTSDDFLVSIQYNTDLFETETIRRMLQHYQTLLQSVTIDPGQQVANLSILTEKQWQQLVIEWNDTDKPYPDDLCIHQLFEAKVAQIPEHFALFFENDRLTYSELNRRANQLSYYLRHNGVEPETIVAICTERSMDFIIALLGVLKAGGAYLPLDSAYPEQRLYYMLKDAGVSILLTQQHLVDKFSGLNIEMFCLDTDWHKVADEPDENPAIEMNPDNLAYVIYTSGSTGQPKGTLLQHRGLCNFITEYVHHLKVDINSRFLQFSSFSFDASVAEIFTTLVGGATLVLARRDTLLSNSDLINVLKECKITNMILPPSMLAILPSQDLSDLKTVMSAGESCNREIVSKWAVGRNFINGYGPTEATVGPIIHRVWDVAEKKMNIPIGRPVANIKVYLLDQMMRLVPVGVSGELYLGGVCLARGYLNRPRLTAEKFVPDPFTSQTGARLYKTGDLARYLPNGNIEFLARVDKQVKIRGFRIELKEIEATLREHPLIEDAVAVANQDKGQIFAYYTLPKIEAYQNKKLELWPSVAEFFVYDDLLYYAMTHDERRNDSYKIAIKQLVKDKVVVDIGTGKDVILARFCVEAGAKKVYAIELLKQAFQQAKSTITKLGLENKITLIQGDSTQVQLPEKVDVCVSEIVGPIGGCEGAAIILNDARRFLKDDGVMIPCRSVTKIAALTLPDDFLNNIGFTDVTANYVRQIFQQVGYRFDLRLCLKGLNEQYLVSDADIFEDLDFSNEVDQQYSRQLNLAINRNARLDGFVVWLNLYTVPDDKIDILAHQHCWLPVYFPAFYPGIKVSQGDRIKGIIISTVCENNINPDYKIKGAVIKKGGKVIDFEYSSYHYKKSYQSIPFYRELFFDDHIKVVKTDQPEGLTPYDIKMYLKTRLPEFMMPNGFMMLDKIPLTASGKVNFRALPDIEMSRKSETFVKPSTEIEKAIANVWQEALQIESISIHDNVFDLGAHSLILVKVQTQLNKLLKKDISIVEMFKYPTISDLIKYLTEKDGTHSLFVQKQQRASQQKEFLQRMKKRRIR